ncbi:MAG TPA: hypothetical protein PLQ76_01770 [bacterium]|nr:hypothetical protein [bacterium]
MLKKIPVLQISVFVLIVIFSCFSFARQSGAEGLGKLKLLTANIGNADVMNCGPEYMFKLCIVKWEKQIADGIAAVSPDIVSLQEVFDVQWCERREKPEKSPKKACYNYKQREPIQQVRRVLGPEYTIVCDGRANFECIGVKKTVGAIEGCGLGEMCNGAPAAITHELPEDCDQKTVIFGVNAVIGGLKIRIINAHPSASETNCRAAAIKRMFEGYGKILPLASMEIPTLAMGDLNMDPYRDDAAKPDVSIWRSYVGKGRPFRYLSGIAENDPPLLTCAGRSIDQVITNFAGGSCKTLGAAPGTARLDNYPADKPITEAPDHKAILCEIEIMPETAPRGSFPPQGGCGDGE